MKIKKYLLIIVVCISNTFAKAAIKDTAPLPGFKEVWIYGNTKNPSSVVIILTGDGGWVLGVVEVAKSLSLHNAMIIGVGTRPYFRKLDRQNSDCYSVATDFENLSKYIQKKYHLPAYIKPIILGYSSGATLAYAILAQAPEHTFQGAISLGFCSDLNIKKPLCEKSGLECHKLIKGKGYDLSPSKNLADPFIVLQGTNDKTCHLCLAQDFVNQTPNAELFELYKIQHGALTLKKWIPKIIEAYNIILNHNNSTENNMSVFRQQSISEP